MSRDGGSSPCNPPTKLERLGCVSLSGPGQEDKWGFELRSFCDEDADAVWHLHDAALEDAGAHGGRGPWEDDLRDIRGTYLDSGGDFLVGLLDGELVAMGGLLIRAAEEAEIKRMRVHPEFQRRGFARSYSRNWKSEPRRSAPERFASTPPASEPRLDASTRARATVKPVGDRQPGSSSSTSPRASNRASRTEANTTSRLPLLCIGESVHGDFCSHEERKPDEPHRTDYAERVEERRASTGSRCSRPTTSGSSSWSGRSSSSSSPRSFQPR